MTIGQVGVVGAEVLDDLRDRLSRRPGELTPQRVAEALREAGRPVGDAMVLAVYESLRRDVVGAGPLEPLLRTPGVTDVLVNGPEQVHLDRGQGLEATGVRFADEAAVRRLAQRLAAQGGRRLDDATPYVDVRLRDGTRLHAVLAPLARPGTVLSLRVPRREGFDLAALVSGEALDLVRGVMEARLAFLISGGTGSGKTTLLSAMLSQVDPKERLVLVEDSSELRPAHPHVVGLEARPPNIEGAGEITVRTLVRQALRMRPDRLVVGEVRGGEVVELLAALNTGHEGGCGTLHANSAGDVPARVEALALAAGLGREAVHAQLASAVDVVLHVQRTAGGRRHLSQVALLERGERGWVVAVQALEIDPEGSVTRGPAAGRLLRRLEARHV
ncbi:TadA family conjugal transfer-associated ATPase [Nocardioides salsibiostraticola]